MNERSETLKNLVVTKRVFGKDVPIVRAGVSFFLYSALPLAELGPTAAELIERFLEMTDGHINAYEAKSGYKPLSTKVLRQHLATLRQVPDDYETLTLHYKDGVDPACGRYGLYLEASTLTSPDKPLATNLLVFDWPYEFALDESLADSIWSFASASSSTGMFVSGNAGLSFVHPQTFPTESRTHIQSLMARFLAFDPHYRRVRFFMRDRSPSAHWINILGLDLTNALGGPAALRGVLPREVELTQSGSALLIRSSKLPPICDRNRRCEDAGALPAVARALKPVRFEISGFGGEGVDAEAWLSRFDDL